MPYQFTWTKKSVCAKLTGVVSLEEALAVNLEFQSHQYFDRLNDFIFDATEVERFDFDEKHADTPAIYDKGASLSNANIKGAFVVKNEQVRGVLKRYLKTSAQLNTCWKLNLFHSVNDAKEWLSA